MRSTRQGMGRASSAAPCTRPGWAPPLRGGVARLTLYDLLGVSSDANAADVRAAYRRAARQLHPDIDSSVAARDRFALVRLAADVLASPQLRAAYDVHGAGALSGGRFEPLRELLAAAAAQASAGVVPEAGADISTVLGIPFADAVTGCVVNVTTAALGACPDCRGSGIAPDAAPVHCSVCRGGGSINVRRWAGAGLPRIAVSQPCPGCSGSGHSEMRRCHSCGGDGRQRVRRRVRIRVPAGVAEGQVLCVRGQGHAGRLGGPAGNLHVKLQVYDLEGMRREGDNLHSTLQLDLFVALLGGTVRVQTVRGERMLPVPSGTQHGAVLTAHGAGVARPGVGGVSYGSHYFNVSLQVPDVSALGVGAAAVLERLAFIVSGGTGRGGGGGGDDADKAAEEEVQLVVDDDDDDDDASLPSSSSVWSPPPPQQQQQQHDHQQEQQQKPPPSQPPPPP